VTPTLVEGRGGIFEVAVDGRRIFSKKSAGRFPVPGEILTLLRPPA
jgi:selT/selW/selH-like putative selenoprotein